MTELRDSGRSPRTTLRTPLPERELWVPVPRLRPIVQHYRGGRKFLSEAVCKKLTAIEKGYQDYVSLTVVDKLLYALDLDEWLRYPQEDGGLADIYFDGAQYGTPSVPPPARLIYTTESERREAIRRTNRESARRRKKPPVEVPCSGCGILRTVGSKYASKATLTVCVPCANRGLVAA